MDGKEAIEFIKGESKDSILIFLSTQKDFSSQASRLVDFWIRLGMGRKEYSHAGSIYYCKNSKDHIIDHAVTSGVQRDTLTQAFIYGKKELVRLWRINPRKSWSFHQAFSYCNEVNGNPYGFLQFPMIFKELVGDWISKEDASKEEAKANKLNPHKNGALICSEHVANIVRLATGQSTLKYFKLASSNLIRPDHNEEFMDALASQYKEIEKVI